MLNRLVKFWTSLRLTVVCLAFGIVLVFVGTIAQADEGLYQAQERYFKHWFVWGISFFGHKLPVGLPGGYLIGTVLLINLVAAHIKRFQLSWKKFGIHIAHAGIIVLLLGQLATDLLSRETQIHYSQPNETKNYSESSFDYELAFVSDANPSAEQVIAIPESRLTQGADISHEQLPVSIRVKEFWPNSEPAFRAPMTQNGPPQASEGLAKFFDFHPLPVTHAMNDKNVPTAVVELSGASGPLGTWTVSGWAADEKLIEAIHRSWQRQLGRQAAQSMLGRLITPQTVERNGKSYTFSLRPVRAVKPFTLTLLTTKHELYPGTSIPKNFQSRVRIENERTGENREVDISMNDPLRYEGLTFYQYQMGEAELSANARSSTLQVVRNPSWLAPYLGCILVGAGLTIQFMYHLIGFIRKRAS